MLVTPGSERVNEVPKKNNGSLKTGSSYNVA